MLKLFISCSLRNGTHPVGYAELMLSQVKPRLWCWHPTRVQVWVLATPLPIRLPTLREITEVGPGAWVHVGDLDRFACFLVFCSSPGCCSHWEVNQLMEENCCLPLCNFAFQISQSILKTRKSRLFSFSKCIFFEIMTDIEPGMGPSVLVQC